MGERDLWGHSNLGDTDGLWGTQGVYVAQARAMGHMGSMWQSDLWGIKGSMGQRGPIGGMGCSSIHPPCVLPAPFILPARSTDSR